MVCRPLRFGPILSLALSRTLGVRPLLQALLSCTVELNTVEFSCLVGLTPPGKPVTQRVPLHFFTLKIRGCDDPPTLHHKTESDL